MQLNCASDLTPRHIWWYFILQQWPSVKIYFKTFIEKKRSAAEFELRVTQILQISKVAKFANSFISPKNTYCWRCLETKKRRKWCEWDSPNLRAGVSEACRNQNRMFFFHWLWKVPYLIVGLTDYHEFHVIKITEKYVNVVGHTWLSPVSHHQDNREIYNTIPEASVAGEAVILQLSLLIMTIIRICSICFPSIVCWHQINYIKLNKPVAIVRFESTVVNFLDFQLWQQTEPLETALQRG